MNFKRGCFFFFAIGATYSLVFCGICSGGPIFDIKPKVALDWRSDSNYYKSENDPREVFTYLVQPGVDFSMKTAKSEIVLGYTMDAHFYDDRDPPQPGQQSTKDDDFIGHTGDFKGKYQLFDRLLLTLEDSLSVSRDPAMTDEFSNETDRNKYLINNVTPGVFYEFLPRFTLGLRYRNRIENYLTGNPEIYPNSTENRGMLDLVFNFSRTASLDLDYQHWRKDYDGTSTSPYTSDQLKLVFMKQAKYYAFEAGLGYQGRRFDDPNLKDGGTPTYRIGITMNYPSSEARRSYLSVFADSNFNDQGLDNSYYKAYRFTLKAGHVFLEKILAEIGGYYQISDYEFEDRQDNKYDVSGSIGYRFLEWLTFTVGGGYERRTSDQPIQQYDNRYVMARLQFVYPLGSR
jgi:hypothetical protein